MVTAARLTDPRWAQLHALLSVNRMGDPREISYAIGTDLEMDFYNAASEMVPLVAGNEFSFDGPIRAGLMDLHNSRSARFAMPRLISKLLLHMHAYWPTETHQAQDQLERSLFSIQDKLAEWEVEGKGNRVFEAGRAGFLIGVKRMAKSYARMGEQQYVTPKEMMLAAERFTEDHERLFSTRISPTLLRFEPDTIYVKAMPRLLRIIRGLGEAPVERILVEAQDQDIHPRIARAALKMLLDQGLIIQIREGWYQSID